MYKIAMIEDEAESANRLKDCLDSYSKETGITFNIIQFSNGFNFISEYTNDYDLVFMDIEMPYMNGLQLAKELRKKDIAVALVFVTHLAKYAIKGYEFGALDYVLKPVNYNSFKIKLDRVLSVIKRKEKTEIILPVKDGFMKMDVRRLNYVEIIGHKAVYHTEDGNYELYKSLSAIESLLPKEMFHQCNRCYLVNLRNVTHIDGNYVYIGEEKLILSRPRRKDFIEALHNYILSYSTKG